VLSNLVADLSFSLQRIDCDYVGQACLVATAQAFWLYAIFFGLVVVWHVAAFAPDWPRRRMLQIAVSPVSFSVLLIGLVSSLWLYRATTTVDYHGFFQTPLPVIAFKIGLMLLLPIFVLTKVLWAVACAVRVGIKLWHRG